MLGQRLSVLVAAIFAGLLACTADSPLVGGRVSTVTMRFLTPATVKSLVIEVTGPGIDPAAVMNIPVGTDTTASGSLTLPSGSARRFVVTAVDTAGAQTHRADTTITLQPGTNPNLTMRLTPLPSTLGITVTFGGVRLMVPDTSTRVLSVWDSTTIVASVAGVDGAAIPADSIRWATSNPSIVSVMDGQVQALREGEAQIGASFRGATARVTVRVVEPEVSGLRMTLVGPSGSGFFITQVTGPALEADVWSLHPATGDSTRVMVDAPGGQSVDVRVFAIDERTDPRQTLGGWSRVLGAAVSPQVPLALNRRVQIKSVAKVIGVEVVAAQDTVNAFTPTTVTWNLTDTSAAVFSFGNHHANYALGEWPDVGCNAFFCGGIGPYRLDASVVDAGIHTRRYSSTIPGQDLAGVRYWRVVHWQGTPLAILAVFSPSTIADGALRRLVIRPTQQAMRIRMQGPFGTGTFFAKITGGPLSAPVWRRINALEDNTAEVVQDLPASSGYEVTVYAMDRRTNPANTLGGWSIVHGVTRKVNVTVSASDTTVLDLEAQPVSVEDVMAPDTVQANTPIPMSWVLSDTTGALASFGNHHIGFAESLWPDVGCDANYCGGIGPGRTDATRVLLPDGRYRYSVVIPPQTVAGRIAWKINHWQGADPLEGGGILAVFAPSTVAGDEVRYIVITP